MIQQTLACKEMVQYITLFLPIGYLPGHSSVFAGPRFIAEQFGITDYSIPRAVCWHNCL